MDGASPLADFCDQVYLPPLAECTSEPNHVRAALRHLSRYLKRAPRIDDLTSRTLIAFCFSLMEQGRARGTCDRYRETLLRVAKAAHVACCLSDMPRVKKLRRRWNRPTTMRPMNLAALNRLFASARSAPGTIAGRPASAFWQALLFAVLDVRISHKELLRLGREAFDGKTLRVGFCRFSLHPRTIAAIKALGSDDRAKLIPWDGDGGDTFEMLAYHYRYILKAAGLPIGKWDLFSRLRFTGQENPTLIDDVDLAAPFEPADLSGYQPRLRKNRPRRPGKNPKPIRRQGTARQGAAAPQPPALHVAPTGKQTPDLYFIMGTPEHEARTMRAFFDGKYAPVRLADAKQSTVEQYRTILNRLRTFLLYDPAWSEINDDLIERFLAWMAAAGYSPATRKRSRGSILTIWRYAHRKGATEILPRDIPEVKQPKRLPTAWSLKQLSALLAIAATVPGNCGRHKASLFWCAAISCMYDSALRLSSLLALRTEDVNLADGWIVARHETVKDREDLAIPITDRSIELLSAMDLQPGELVFSWPFKGHDSFRGRLRRLLAEAGLPHGRRDLAHRIRRTAITYAVIAGGIEFGQRLAGHSTPQLTRQNYVDPTKVPKPDVPIAQPDFVSPVERAPVRLLRKPQNLLGHEPEGGRQ